MNSLQEQVEAALRVSSGLSLSEIIRLTNSADASTHGKMVLQALNALRKDNKIERDANGRWQLAQPKPPVKPAKPKQQHRSIDDE